VVAAQSVKVGREAGVRRSTRFQRGKRRWLGNLAQGVSNNEIGRALGVEVVTVKRHVGNILRKLRLRYRTQAAICLVE
jgi:ATP/maltotriose-dependent transcriptional regulator MalT